MTPTIGRIVLYTLTDVDAYMIDKRRTDSNPPQWHQDARTHVGNTVSQGDTFPMIIVKTWGNDLHSAVNGQVMLDGNHTFWVTSRFVDTAPVEDQPTAGMFRWPTRT